MHIKLQTFVVFLCMFLSACSTVSQNAVFQDVQTSVQERTGVRVVWSRDKETEAEVQDRLREISSAPLTVESAIEMALLNNKKIQATYERLGVSRAELVQAGLLQNPVFEFRQRFPEGGGRTNIEFGLSQTIFDALFIPLKRRIAENHLEVTKLAIAKEIVEMATEVKLDYYELQAALEMLSTKKNIQLATGAAYLASKKIHAAGNITDLALWNERVFFEQAKIERLSAESEVEEKKGELSAILGADSYDIGWSVSSQLPLPPEEQITLKELEQTALQQSLDLKIARLEIELLAKELGLTAPFLLSDSSIGIDAERESDGAWVLGPSLHIPLPIFDQGQAFKEGGNAKLRLATANYEALINNKKVEVAVAVKKMEKARKKVELYKSTILPLRSSLTSETQLMYNAMLLGVFDLLLAKQNEIQAGADYVQALKEFWLARTELEKAIGTNIKVETLTRENVH